MTTLAAPVRFDKDHGVHVVTGYEEASAILRGFGWSSDPRLNPFTPEELRQVPPANMLLMDPPDHTRLRRLVAPAFSARAIEALRPRVRAIVRAALDQLEDEADLVAEVGYLVPLAVIAELLDVGADGADLLHDVTPDLVRTLEVDAGEEDFAAAGQALIEITMFLTPLIAHRRHHPGDDFISALLSQPELSLDEVLATTVLLLAAGHETTANLIANGALALLEHPDQQALLHADPARGVDELVRLVGPVKLAGRTAAVDQDIAGHAVREGEFVLISIEEANRDPRRFVEPLRLDLSRSGVANLGFGAGAHFCLGTALARLEAAETLTALLDTYPDVALAPGPIRRRESTTFRALEELSVRLSP